MGKKVSGVGLTPEQQANLQQITDSSTQYQNAYFNNNQIAPPVRQNIAPPVSSENDAISMSKDEVGDSKSANKYINRFNNPSELFKPADRSGSIRTIAKNIESDLMGGNKAPKKISLLDEYKKQQKEAGLDDLSQLINDLKSQEKDVQANLRINKFDQEGKPISMGVIEGRQGELTRQAREELDFIQRQKDYAVNEYNSKLSTINTIMKYTEKDYENSVKDYEREFTMRKSLYNMASEEYDAELKAEKQDYDIFREAQKDARANGEIVVTTAAKAGKTFKDMDEETQLQLSQWGVQSGLGKDFFKNMFDVAYEKPVLTTITSKDKSHATIIFKDGTTKMIKTGIYDAPSSSTELTKKATMVSKLREIAADDSLSDVDKMLEMKAAGATDSIINQVLNYDDKKQKENAQQSEDIAEVAQKLIINNIKGKWFSSGADEVDKSYEQSLSMLEEAKQRDGKVDVPLDDGSFETVVLTDDEIKAVQKELKYYGKKARDKQWNIFNYKPNEDLN